MDKKEDKTRKTKSRGIRFNQSMHRKITLYAEREKIKFSEAVNTLLAQK